MATQEVAEHISDAYARLFTYLDLGRAIYRPPPRKELKPNCLGYFDYNGDWYHILDLDDDVQLRTAGLSRPAVPPKELEAVIRTWLEPIASSNVSSKKFYGTAGAQLNQTGLPVGLKLSYQFTTQQDVGAVLITSPEVTRRRSQLPWTVIQEWVVRNLSTLMSGYLANEFKKFGFCVIKDTHNVEKYAINAWRGAGTSTFFGSNATGSNILDAGLGLEWYQGNSIGKWDYGQSEDQLAVFATGLHFKVSKTFKRHNITASPNLRADDARLQRIVRVELQDDTIVDLNFESIGSYNESDDIETIDREDFETMI